MKKLAEKCDYLIVGLQTDPTLDLDYRLKTDDKQKINQYSHLKKD